MTSKQGCKDCNKSLEDCTCIKDTINFPKQRLEKYSERFDNKDNELVEGVFNPENWGKRLVKEEPKQETLEEAAKRLYPLRNTFLERFKDLEQKIFIEGAKWQTERSYSEEEVINLLYIRSMCQEHYESDAEIREWFNKFKNK
jgi:hypothetical protein